MKKLKRILLLLTFFMLFCCEKNEPRGQNTSVEEDPTSATEITSTDEPISNQQSNQDSTAAETNSADGNSGWEGVIKSQFSPSKPLVTVQNPNQQTTQHTAKVTQADFTPNSPLRILLKNAEVGKSYSKKELIEQYKFPKEAVDLIKKVTCVGPNKLYFNWGSTWLVEKVSDAEFENDTMIFSFKKNKTYVSGGAIGIKYNKKTYTELILNNGSAYIPSVKGFHWEIAK